MEEFHTTDIGAGSRLRAAQLRELTGLSDRQLHEWDKRGALPHDRAKGGQRRVSRWEAMALKILAAIRDRYQPPLTKLRPLLQWMIGNDLSDFDRALAVTAGSELIPQTQAQADFLTEFVRLSLEPSRGISFLKEVPALLARADKLGNPGAMSAVHRLAAALVPVYRAVGEMTTGFPVFLLSDLQRHSFAGEPLLVDYVRLGALRDETLVMRVDKHINAVFESIGRTPIMVTHRMRDVAEIKGEGLEDKEQTVLDLLRERDFDRIMIEPKGSGYRIEVTREVPDLEAQEIEERLRAHDYQSVMVKMRHGEIARLTQTVSIITPDSADGKTPHRAGTHRSYDE